MPVFNPLLPKYLETNGAAITWQSPEYKALRRGQNKKKKGDYNEPESLKIMRQNLLKSCASIVHSREFHNSKEIHRRPARATPLIPSPKTTRSLSQNHRRNKGRPSLIQATRNELWSKLFPFWLQNCLFLCYARLSFRLMRCEGVSVYTIFNKPATGSIHQNLKR